MQRDGRAEEPSIATVTVVNAIHLQLCFAARLRALLEEGENLLVLQHGLKNHISWRVCQHFLDIHIILAVLEYGAIEYNINNTALDTINKCTLENSSGGFTVCCEYLFSSINECP